MSYNDGQTQSTTRSVVDPALKEKFEVEGEIGRNDTIDQYSKLQGLVNDAIRRGTMDRETTEGQRQQILDRYTQGLDQVGKARFMDALLNNIGKIASGIAGLNTGTPVAKYYKYEGPNIDGMAQDLGARYRAEMEDLKGKDADRRGETDRRIELQKMILEYARDLPKDRQNAILQMLNLTKGQETTGTQNQVQSDSPYKVGMKIDELDRAEEQNRLNREAALQSDLLRIQGNVASQAIHGAGGAGNPKVTEGASVTQSDTATYDPKVIRETKEAAEGIALVIQDMPGLLPGLRKIYTEAKTPEAKNRAMEEMYRYARSELSKYRNRIIVLNPELAERALQGISMMGTAWKAGQLTTPEAYLDFMTAVVSPEIKPGGVQADVSIGGKREITDREDIKRQRTAPVTQSTPTPKPAPAPTPAPPADEVRKIQMETLAELERELPNVSDEEKILFQEKIDELKRKLNIKE